MILPSENLVEQKRLERFHTFKDGIVRYKTGGLGARRGCSLQGVRGLQTMQGA
jgi:hypothetical protein